MFDCLGTGHYIVRMWVRTPVIRVYIDTELHAMVQAEPQLKTLLESIYASDFTAATDN